MSGARSIDHAGIKSHGDALKEGAKVALSAPAWVLVMSFFGFGALAQDLGFSAFQAGLIALFVYALPGQVVLVTAMAGGMAFAPLFLAVSFSAVRLMPMTVSLLPMLRSEETPKWRLYLLAHFVAITIWIESMRHLPHVVRHYRASFFLGFGLAMVATSTVGALAGHRFAADLPVVVAAALLFLMPIYFLVTLSNAARVLSDRLAFVLGLLIGPMAFMLFPDGDLVITGLVGGTLGWLLARKLEAKHG